MGRDAADRQRLGSVKKRSNQLYVNGHSSDYDEDLDQEFLFDFTKVYGSRNTNVIRDYDDTIDTSSQIVMGSDSQFVISGNSTNNVWNNAHVVKVGPKQVEKGTKFVVTPRQVLDQLEQQPRVMDLVALDEKIEIMKMKSELLKQKYAKRECDAMVERLTNRKRYVEFKMFFEQFQTTTDDKIEPFLKKYGFKKETSDLFIPEFPDEAIKTMTSYTKHVDKLCGKKPVFYIIADPKDFQKRVERRDPILLAQSPFGFYWDILGAWDKEMILLSEL
jgi:hypothetical protein